LAPETQNKPTLKPNCVEFDHILIPLNPTHCSAGIWDTTGNHDTLISKLQYDGIRGKAKSLQESYLQNRYQRVHTTNTYLNSNSVSTWTKIKCGVPQGSILGPLFFLIYINDLPTAIKHKALPILFADDTSILLRSPNNIQLQNDLNTNFEQLNNWFISILLFLNLEKLTLFSSLIRVNAAQTYKSNVKANR
jgi:hypothetical protein